MERCKYVEHLATFRDKCKLDEVEGEIVFCESEPSQEGSSLVMKLKGFDGEVRWIYESNISLPALVGQTLRGFYKERRQGGVIIEAYELLKDGEVLRRGKSYSKYKFVDE